MLEQELDSIPKNMVFGTLLPRSFRTSSEPFSPSIAVRQRVHACAPRADCKGLLSWFQGFLKAQFN
jgi:hypothetical protein